MKPCKNVVLICAAYLNITLIQILNKISSVRMVNLFTDIVESDVRSATPGNTLPKVDTVGFYYIEKVERLNYQDDS